MSKRSLLAVPLLVLVLALGMGPLSVPASAATLVDCDTMVVDTSGELGDLGPVEAAAESLRSEGATVRVRVVASLSETDASSMEEFLADEVQRCSSWRGAGSYAKSNLVAFGVATEDRDMNITAGSRYDRTLGSRDTSGRIMDDSVAPFFRDGDFSGGTVAALVGVEDAIDPARAQGPSSSGTASGGGASGTVVLVVLGSILGGLVVLAGLYLLVRLLLARRRLRLERQAVATSASEVKNSASAAFLALDDQVCTVDLDVQVMVMEVSVSDATELSAEHASAMDAVGRARSSFTDATSNAHQPDTRGLTLEDTRSVLARYEAAAAAVSSATTSLTGVSGLVATLREHQATVPVRIEALRAGVVAVRAEIEPLLRSGLFLKEVLAELDVVGEEATFAEKFLAERRLGAADDVLDAAEPSLVAARLAGLGLPERVRSLTVSLAALEGRAAGLVGTETKAEMIVSRMGRSFVSDDVSPVASSVADLRALSVTIRAALEAASSAVSMETQSWDEAATELASASAALDEHDRGGAGVHAHERLLTALRTDLPGRVEAALARHAEVSEFVSRVREDVSFSAHTSALASVLTGLAGLRGETSGSLLAVEKEVEGLTGRLEQVDSAARSEHARMERLRAQAASAISSARSELSSAESYVRQHSSDVSHTARSRLSSAASDLANAQGASSLEDQVRLAQAAASAASSAMSAARSDVSAAESRRAAERRAEEQRRSAAAAAAAAASSSSSSWGGGGSSGSTSSSSW